MAAKEVRFSDDARTRMFRGVNILANAVKATILRCLVSAPCRNNLMAVKPSMSGNCISIKMMSGKCNCASLIPSVPFSACKTW